MADPLLSVVAPCFNEADNLPELVARCRRVLSSKGLAGEIVLVDDGSDDSTRDVILELEGAFPGEVRAELHEKNLGIEAAWRTGLRAARGEYVCFIDADLQNQPEDIARLYAAMGSTDTDLVQGTRSHIGRHDRVRAALSVGLNWMLNLAFGIAARDAKSGFVLARREVLEEILRHRYRYRYFQTFITVAARARGFRVSEVETLFEPRIHGESFLVRFPAAVVLLCLIDVAKALLEYRFGRRGGPIFEELVRERLPPSAPAPVMKSCRKAWLRTYLWMMPIHHWMISRKAGYYYEILERSQWLAPADLRELQELRLRRLVRHAYFHVPYYRELMDRLGVAPEAVRTLEDLRRLPLLEKSTVRERLYSDLMSDNHDKRRVLRVATSGSTGEPLTCWVDRDQLEMRWAATLRGLEWTGYRFGDRSVRLWHQNIGMSRGQEVKERLDARLCRRWLVPAFEFSPDKVRAMERAIRRYRPRLLEGYAESFHYLARSGLDPDLRSLPVRGIVSSAQTLDRWSRQAIEEAFGARVFDKYGSREFSGIAYECERGGRHVVAESYIVEILVEGRPAKPGELGEVVITDLSNRVLPFIRYRIGDLAYAVDRREPCPCGRGLDRMGEVEGRVQSMILGANGRAMPSSFFFHLMKDYGYAFSRFQIEQSAPGGIVFRYVPAERFHRRVLEEVFAVLRRYLSDEMAIEEERVERIEMVRTGKYQVVINRMPLSYRSMDVLDPRAARRAES